MPEATMDREEYTRLYEELAPLIHTWADIRIPATLRRTLQPEDLVQEVWWRALDGLPRFDPARGSFKAWVFSVALHVLLEAARRHRPRNRLQPARRDAVDGLPSDLVAQATSISLRASRSEKAARITEAISSLDAEDRKVLLHCGIEGLSGREAAVLCGIGEEACRKRWQRLRKRLAEWSVWEGILE